MVGINAPSRRCSDDGLGRIKDARVVVAVKRDVGWLLHCHSTLCGVWWTCFLVLFSLLFFTVREEAEGAAGWSLHSHRLLCGVRRPCFLIYYYHFFIAREAAEGYIYKKKKAILAAPTKETLVRAKD